MNKSCFSIVLIALMISSLVLFGAVHFGTAQSSGTDVSGIISVDTTWTQANSPYTLTGALAVNKGATLTIQPGVTVNINSHYIQVNGTLVAIGTNTDQIQFSDAAIYFTSISNGWNQQTSSGSIIENAIMNSSTQYSIISINNASPAIINDTMTGIVGGMFIEIIGGAPIISNCTISGYGLGIALYSNESSIIYNNIISTTEDGIDLYSGKDNSIMERNLIINCDRGIYLNYGASLTENTLIENNTIVENNFGVVAEDNIVSQSAIILFNNIENNTDYNFDDFSSSNFNVAYNWWGTMIAQAINQAISDFKDNFSLGNVSFVPFLTAPNPEAPTYINATAGAGGSITPNGIVSLNYDAKQTFTITPSTGYHIVNVLVNGSSVGAVSSYTVKNIQGATTISATFAPNSTPPEFPSFAILLLVIILAVSVAVVFTLRKRKIGKS